MPDIAPMTAIEALRNRLTLEIPASYIREETIRESDDQDEASYVLTWYRHADAEEEASTINAAEVIEEAAKHLIGLDYEMPYKIGHRKVADGVYRTAVIVRMPKGEGEKRESSIRGASIDESVPVTLYLGSDVYNVGIDGAEFALLKNGHLIEAGLPSVSFSLGRLIFHALSELPTIESENAIEASDPTDFLVGIAQAVIDSPDIDEEALAHFVAFYEMVSLQDFDAMTGLGEL